MEARYETFTTLINRISRNIRKIKNREMAEYGLRSVHISCLFYLYLFEGLTAAELCERCEEDKAAVSRALDHLEREGYLAADSRRTGRYRSALALTDRGREAGGQIAQKIDGVLDTISGALTEEERIAFYRSLAVISDSLDKIAAHTGNNKE